MASLSPNSINMPGSIREVLARRLRELRQERSWSQEDLADACLLHRTYIGSIERAERNVGIDILGKLATAFGISVYELLNASASKQLRSLSTKDVANNEVGRS
jgi:transcriptional regulator with XRE-family HTH domain